MYERISKKKPVYKTNKYWIIQIYWKKLRTYIRCVECYTKSQQCVCATLLQIQCVRCCVWNTSLYIYNKEYNATCVYNARVRISVYIKKTAQLLFNRVSVFSNKNEYISWTLSSYTYTHDVIFRIDTDTHTHMYTEDT